MCPYMPFQVKGIIESFPTEGTQVSLDLAMTLYVAVKHALQPESFAT